MTYSATIFRLLISCPGDVPATDVSAVAKAIGRWNAVYGRGLSAAVVPTHWSAHSAAEHGQRAQASLNLQLVDEADIVVALFWTRLGSYTGVEESGTVEELKRAHERGAYVAILQRNQALPTDVDVQQLERLRSFIDEIRSDSLILAYEDEAELERHVDTIVVRAVTRASTTVEVTAAGTTPPAMIWPRVDATEGVKTDARGRVRTERRLRLVLRNTGGEAARYVRFRLEPEQEDEGMPLLLDHERPLEVLAPDGEASYGIYLHSGAAPQARCVVEWEDSAGSHENAATVRFY